MWIKFALGIVAGIGLITLIGCAANPAAGEKPQAAAPSRGGAELWADNCSRCHNLRPPQSYNDGQWQTVVMHMRMRANLEGGEARLIEQFLQASH